MSQTASRKLTSVDEMLLDMTYNVRNPVATLSKIEPAQVSDSSTALEGNSWIGDDEGNKVVNTSCLTESASDTRSSDERGVKTGLTGIEGFVKFVCHLFVMRPLLLLDEIELLIDEASEARV